MGEEQVYSIALVKWNDLGGAEPILLCAAFDVSSFTLFQRNNQRDFLSFMSKVVSAESRTQPGTRQQVVKDEYRFYVHSKTEGIACVVATNDFYPSKTAFMVCSKILSEFGNKFSGVWEWKGKGDESSITWPELQQHLAKYQNPEEADKIMKIQRDLDQVKTVMMQNIDNICARGEKLDTLVLKSGDLSADSKKFYKTAKKQNACCPMM